MPQAAQAAPPQLGPGYPDQLQSMPGDMTALQSVMMKGFGPGSSDAEHGAAMNAVSMARAAEQQAIEQAFNEQQDQQDVMELGRLLHGIMSRRGLMGASAPQPQGQGPSAGMLPQLGGGM